MKAELAIGDSGEWTVVRYLNTFSGYHAIRLTHMRLQKAGFDILLTKPSGQELIQVKTDLASQTTGNIFWETWAHGRPGWGTKSMDADWYVWVLGDDSPLTWLTRDAAKAVQAEIERNPDRWRHVNTPTAAGYLLPLTDLLSYASYQVRDINPDD